MIADLPEPGTPVDDLDTPTLIVDLATLEGNLARMHGFFRGRPTKVRSVTKSHKCPAIAQMQMTQEGALPYGLCCAKVSEAELMADAGARDIRMIEQVVGRRKIDRLMRLARCRQVNALVDDPRNVDSLAEAAASHRVKLDVLVEVDLGIQRCGVPPGRPAVELARHIATKPHLRFVGLSGHDRPTGIPAGEARSLRVRERLQRLLDTREQMERAGLPVRICAGGSTGSWQIAGTMDGITEIAPGTYALMDCDDLDETLPRDFHAALRILATVLSRPAADRAVTDCGNKAIGYGGPPLVADPRGATVQQLYTEHGALHLEGAARHLRPEDRVVLIPRNHGAAATAHDHLVGVRDGRVECVWELKSSDAHH